MIEIDISTDNPVDYYDNWYKPGTEWEKLSINWCKLPDYYSFDLEKLRTELENVRSKYDFQPFVISKSGKKRMTYQAISLTSRENSEDPEYDGLRLFGFDDNEKEVELDIQSIFLKYYNNPSGADNAPTLNEKIFTKQTDACTGYFQEVINKFHSPKTKCRLLNLKPRGVITPHVDFPYYRQIRVHAAIYTNEDTYYEVEGVKFKIPSDGNFYWFDVGRNHAVANNGTNDRITLSVNLSVYDNYDSSHNLMDLIKNCKI
jgi:hypothetical protein